MYRLTDKWEDFKYFVEDHPAVKWVSGGVVILAVVILGIGFFRGDSSTVDETEDGNIQEVEVEEVDTTDNEPKEMVMSISVNQETVHILENPEQYTEDVVNRAYHDSLTTFDNSFIEDNTFLSSEFNDGVYLYHEKANEEYEDIALQAYEMHLLGVPVYFYTPQLDQSIANISNHTQVLNGGEVEVKAVVVRNGEVGDTYREVSQVKSYMEGVINENTN